jgi:hypothetical protein
MVSFYYFSVLNDTVNAHNIDRVEIRTFLQKIVSITVGHILHDNKWTVISMVGAKEGCKGNVSSSRPKVENKGNTHEAHSGVAKKTISLNNFSLVDLKWDTVLLYIDLALNNL